jgi:Putative beta-lactamase-inhibitor-like, PepSY-like
MKKSMIILALYFVMTSTFAQKNIPVVVKDAFEKQFPGVKAIKWDKENTDYEASFKINKINNSVLFDSQGNILETEKEISITDLPKGILDYVSKNYPTQKVKGAAQINSAKQGLLFEIEVKGKDILFDANGAFLKEVID